ncbi:MAG TPA: DUF2207 domain-containing protein [Flavitalea sp.]|nr:DUF2207 domain-containing protein [Flavitalea sp.]
MSRKFIFLVLFIAFCSAVTGQEFIITEFSTRFVGERDFDSIIRVRSLPLAASRNISPAIFDQRYPSVRGQFSDLMKGLLTVGFTNSDRRYENVSKTSSTFNKARREYLFQIGEAVKKLLQMPVALQPLFTADNSDRILTFHSDVEVKKDGKLEVKETIRIYNGNGSSDKGNSNNDDIKRGIVRDFPTKYLDSNGFWSTTSFNLRRVTKNGAEEPFIKESLSNGTRIKTGSKDILLNEGVYTYVFEYTTQRQLIHHDDKDELYWNVNGTGWVFSIDSISCQIRFPAGAAIQESACYTGVLGSREQNCKSSTSSGTLIEFAATHPLQSYEGLTVAVSIQKGIIDKPSSFAKRLNTLQANYYIFLLAIAAIGLLLYYFFTWRKWGRDPDQGTIIPQFEPPKGFFPADVGYVLKQQFEPHLFAATLIDAAVHKHLKIEVDKKGWLIKKPIYNFMAVENGEAASSTAIGRYGFDITRIYGQSAERGKYNSTLKTLQDSLESALKNRYLVRSKSGVNSTGLFRLNTRYIAIGVLVLIASAIGGFIFLTNNFSIILLLISVILFLIMVITHMIFAKIMSAYTNEGRKAADHILGFKMYLQQAEQKVFDQLTPPEKTLDLFEKYLPYAVALEVENQWASKFESMLQQALEQGYQPSYYFAGRGMGHSFSASDMSSGLSSGLSNTISSASTPPSSSGGGSGGGGSSGGGGGGGGGGGW